MSAVCAKENDPFGVFSFKSLYDAYLACRAGKRNTINALQFEADLLGNLSRLQYQLATARYRPTRSVCFYTTKPKLREIVAADFSDRVVHHWLVPRLEAYFDRKFIYDNYACRVGKGHHAAVKRLRQFMRGLHPHGGYYLQLDIRSFFMSIDHDILLAQLASHVKDPHLIELATTLIRHNPVQNCIVKDNQNLANRIPAHKSLFHLPPGKGLPIGNLSSQFFANVYLNELDQFIKHQLKCRYYLRYVDDFVLLHESPEYLRHAKQQIAQFCADQLKLEFKQNAQVKLCNQGIDFLGYISRSNYVLVRKRVLGNLKNKLQLFQQQIEARGRRHGHTFQHLHLQVDKVFQLQQVLAAYLGHFKHANSYRLCQALFQRYGFLSAIFDFDAQQLQLRSRLMPQQTTPTLKSQVIALRALHPGLLLLVQVGRFCELYDESAIAGEKVLKLTPRRSQRDFDWQAGFPMRGLSNVKKRLQKKSIAYAVIAETGWLSNGLKRRLITEQYNVLAAG